MRLSQGAKKASQVHGEVSVGTSTTQWGSTRERVESNTDQNKCQIRLDVKSRVGRTLSCTVKLGWTLKAESVGL
jgi:hypothetical protein